jgi:ATP-dependent 26S proteasome regulatory subunit
MPDFEIDTYNAKELAYYLYAFKENLDTQSNYIVKSFKNTKIENATHISDIGIMLGYGEFTYNLDENTKIIIKHEQKGQPVGTTSEAIIYEKLTVCCDTFEIWEKFRIEINTFLSKFDKSDTNKLNIYVADKYGDWYKYSKIPSRLLSTIYLEDNIKHQLKTDITKFIENELEYEKFGIPYKRTYMITGVPGSGKTSIIKALCNEFDRNLCILSVNKDFDNSTILNAFKNLRDKSFLLIEDIDCLFEKREHKDNPLITFSSFINVLDGVLYKHGLICFITTNHPERLDHALLRSGRMDLILKIDYPSKNDIKRLFVDLNSKTSTQDIIDCECDKFIDKISGKNIPMSAIVNFLFKYRIDAMKNINELISTNAMITEFIGDKSATLLYS